jgi:hypothetical protein
MNTTVTQPPPLPERTLRDLDVGCRIGFLVVTAILAYAAFYLSWLFSSLHVSNLYDAMFKGSSLPATLSIAESGKFWWLRFSILLPLVAVGAGLSIRRPLHALLVIAGCTLGLAVIVIFLSTALLDGIGKMISSLT